MSRHDGFVVGMVAPPAQRGDADAAKKSRPRGAAVRNEKRAGFVPSAYYSESENTYTRDPTYKSSHTKSCIRKSKNAALLGT